MSAIRQGKYGEARRYTEENLAMFKASGNDSGKAVAQTLLGVINFLQGNYDEAQRYFEQSLAHFREFNTIWGLVFSVNYLGAVTISRGDYIQAHTYSTEGLKKSQEFGFKAGIALSRYIQGSTSLCEKDFIEAQSNLEESLTLYRERGDNYDLSMVLSILGLTMAKQGKAAEAKRYYEEGFVISHSLRNSLFLGQNLTGLVGLWIEEELKYDRQASLNSLKNTLNPLVQATQLSGAISALLTSSGAVMFRPFSELYGQNLALIRSNLAEVNFQAAFAEGEVMTMDEAVAKANSYSKSEICY